MLKFGILGIGQGGTSIAEYAFTRGFKTVVANTAQVDLEQAKYIPNDCKIYLGGRGAGRERSVGAEAMIENAEKLFEKCKEEFSDCDAVLAVGTGGGGTGSGGLPIAIEILMNFHKYVGAIIVLPDEQESPKSKMNTLECFSQISQFEGLGSVFIIDNNKAKETYPNFSRKMVYQVTNKEVIDLLCELNQLTELPSYVANFDDSDLLGIIQERGYTLLSKVEYYGKEDEDPFDIATRIRNSWNRNFQPMFNDGQILKGAILGKVFERTSSKVNTELIFQETGIPFDFNDVYFMPDENDIDRFRGKCKNIFYTILSGLAFPKGRLDEMDNTLKTIEEKLVKNFDVSQNQKFESEKWSSKFGKKSAPPALTGKQEKPQKINLMDKLSKYKS